ncbi:MAG: AI-2E family transporter [bacterium]|nr:AI-2E family transporter [bacterium]MDZ4231446.1 AI-2E family transporter [Patescibacteria group bacterium]
MAQQNIEVSWVSLWRVLLMIGFGVALFLMRETVAILLLALLISTIFDAPVDALERHRVPRILGTILVYLVAFVGLAFLFYAVIPIAILELNNLLKNIGGILESNLGFALPSGNTSFFLNTDVQQFTEALLSGGVSFIEILGALVGGVTFVIAVIVLSFYLTVSRDGVSKFLVAIFPDGIEKRVLDLYVRTKKRIAKWFQAQIFLSLVVGTLAFTGLSLLGVKYALVLGIIAGVLELIPIVGPIFAGALAVMVALTGSWDLGFYTLLLFLGIQQLENNVLVPLVMRRQTGVHPVMILVSILGGAQIAGLVGVLLAVPTAVFLQEMAEEWMSVKSKRKKERLAV